MSEVCVKCNGKKQVYNLDIAKARSSFVLCPDCKGTGEKPNLRPTDGNVCVRLKCEVLLFQHLIDSCPIATLELRVWPLIKKNVWITSAFGKHVWAEIPRMHTKSKHRGKGIMSKLLALATTDPKMDHISTSYDDSTEQGRAFLMKNGFNKEGDTLVWRRNKGSSADSHFMPI